MLVCNDFQSIVSGLKNDDQVATSERFPKEQRPRYQVFRDFKDPASKCDLNQLVALTFSGYEFKSIDIRDAAHEAYEVIVTMLSPHFQSNSEEFGSMKFLSMQLVKHLVVEQSHNRDKESMRPTTPPIDETINMLSHLDSSTISHIDSIASVGQKRPHPPETSGANKRSHYD